MKKEKQKNHFRHGDVILKPAKIPAEAVKQKHLTLAEGEVTGHSHRIASGKAVLFKFDEKTYLRVTSPFACLRHEEHKEIKLPAGDYECFIQQEWKEDGWKKVID